jgi:hypothetical protein
MIEKISLLLSIVFLLLFAKYSTTFAKNMLLTYRCP